MSDAKPRPSDESRSKIGRLQFRERMEFHRMLRDKVRGPKLAEWLAAHGVEGVNAANLSDYRKSKSYREWLKGEEQIQRERDAAENSMRLVNAMAGHASENIKAILAGRAFPMMQALADPNDIDPFVHLLDSVTAAERVEVARALAEERKKMGALAREKFETEIGGRLLTMLQDKAAMEIANSSAPQSEKIAALRKQYFADVDALEASGAVVLPQ